MKNPLPRIWMLDGFNEGWISFSDDADRIKGSVTAKAAIAALVAGTQKLS